MGGGAWPFLVRGVICLLNCDNERDLNLLNSGRNVALETQGIDKLLQVIVKNDLGASSDPYNTNSSYDVRMLATLRERVEYGIGCLNPAPVTENKGQTKGETGEENEGKVEGEEGGGEEEEFDSVKKGRVWVEGLIPGWRRVKYAVENISYICNAFLLSEHLNTSSATSSTVTPSPQTLILERTYSSIRKQLGEILEKADKMIQYLTHGINNKIGSEESNGTNNGNKDNNNKDLNGMPPALPKHYATSLEKKLNGVGLELNKINGWLLELSIRLKTMDNEGEDNKSSKAAAAASNNNGESYQVKIDEVLNSIIPPPTPNVTLTEATAPSQGAEGGEEEVKPTEDLSPIKRIESEITEKVVLIMNEIYSKIINVKDPEPTDNNKKQQPSLLPWEERAQQLKEEMGQVVKIKAQLSETEKIAAERNDKLLIIEAELREMRRRVHVLELQNKNLNDKDESKVLEFEKERKAWKEKERMYSEVLDSVQRDNSTLSDKNRNLSVDFKTLETEYGNYKNTVAKDLVKEQSMKNTRSVFDDKEVMKIKGVLEWYKMDRIKLEGQIGEFKMREVFGNSKRGVFGSEGKKWNDRKILESKGGAFENNLKELEKEVRMRKAGVRVVDMREKGGKGGWKGEVERKWAEEKEREKEVEKKGREGLERLIREVEKELGGGVDVEFGKAVWSKVWGRGASGGKKEVEEEKVEAKGGSSEMKDVLNILRNKN
eukprot:TRINITY_DN3626_c0_g1_i2.p1 TRINITY_DN3626_c0_g1~~TRINITY_DN3626_c0_g1_i2.p1  ORF type:complete len:717 (-),score=298.95 TRINITY_DN3626_c0_g1_i2:34-2184(-)